MTNICQDSSLILVAEIVLCKQNMQRFVYIFTYYEIIKILKVGSFTPFLAPA